MKPLSAQIFPVQNYTDKVHTGVRATLAASPFLSFTIAQIVPSLQRGYPWLKSLDERQTILLRQLIKTGLTKLVQLGLVKSVSSKVQVDPQWQWASKVSESGYVNVTSNDNVAQTDEAKKKVSRRALGGNSLWRLNNTKPKLGIFHA